MPPAHPCRGCLRLALSAALAGLAVAEFTGSFGGILWQGGFENGTLEAEYDEIVGDPPPGRTTVRSVAGGIRPRCGDQFLEVKINGSDTAYGHNRVEIGFSPSQQIPESMEGTVRYYGWSMGHDTTKPLSKDSSYELAYWESKNVWSQTLGFYISDGQTLKLRTRGASDTDVGSFDFPAGRWHDFVMGISWSAEKSHGWVQLWKDGKEVVPKTPHATLQDDNPSYSHLGIFRIPRVDTEVVMFYDCVVYAGSYDPEDCCYNDTAQLGLVGHNLSLAESIPAAAAPVFDGAIFLMSGGCLLAAVLAGVLLVRASRGAHGELSGARLGERRPMLAGAW